MPFVPKALATDSGRIAGLLLRHRGNADLGDEKFVSDHGSLIFCMSNLEF
jgi:hypothetical protein